MAASTSCLSILFVQVSIVKLLGRHLDHISIPLTYHSAHQYNYQLSQHVFPNVRRLTHLISDSSVCYTGQFDWLGSSPPVSESCRGFVGRDLPDYNYTLE